VTPVGPAVFAALVWGTVLGVLLVFLYEAYALAGDAGWRRADRPPGAARRAFFRDPGFHGCCRTRR
jgi:hypothetical protein